MSIQSIALWIAAVLSLLLLVTHRSAAEILVSRDRSSFTRLVRGCLYLLLPLLVVVPVMSVEAPNPAGPIALFGCLLFFSGFCYYLGKNVGLEEGKRFISDLVGIDSAESLEDSQDRLFESKLRFPNRAEVVKSISNLVQNRLDTISPERQGGSDQSKPSQDIAPTPPPFADGRPW